MSYDRKMRRRLATSGVQVSKLADAAKAHTNMDKVKDLNTLLGMMQEMAPHLEETRMLCVMLIQEKRDMDRRLARQEAALLRALSEQDTGILNRYQKALEEWDLANPPEEISAALPPPPPMHEQANGAPL